MTTTVVGACLAGSIACAATFAAAHAQDLASMRPARDGRSSPSALSTLSYANAAPLSGFAMPRKPGPPIFSDDFQTFRTWNGKTGWNVTGGPQWSALGRVIAQGTLPYNNEMGWYLNPNYFPRTTTPLTAANGLLSLKATPYPQKTKFDLFPYTSGMITSYLAFRPLYGYFEMRARLPRGQGFLPAFWLLPADGSHGEIDAMEVLGSDPTRLYTTVHSYSTGQLVSTGMMTTIPDASSAFHTYGVNWQQDYITWYFDGQQIFKTATPPDLKKPMYMIVNVAVGGTWPGPPEAGSAAEMTIDYIRAYRFSQQRLMAAN